MEDSYKTLRIMVKTWKEEKEVYCQHSYLYKIYKDKYKA